MESEASYRLLPCGEYGMIMYVSICFSLLILMFY